MAKRSAPSAAGQIDLFAHAELFPVRRPEVAPRSADLSLRIKTAMGQALKACPDSAVIVAAKIAEMTGREMTVDALYTYTAPSKEHDIGLSRFVAFVRATGAFWLWDLLVEDDGLMVLEGREARLAQLGHLRQESQRLAALQRDIERELQVEPVRIKSRRPVPRAVRKPSLSEGAG